MAIRVSVIIPVYNAEYTIRQCLDSVLKQTYRNIEVICVNDGSTDHSLSILNDYAAKDTRIHVINQKNSHAGIARNHGIQIATGDYIYFIDADDFMDKDLLEDFVSRAEEFDADLVLSPIDSYNNQTREFIPRPWSLAVNLIRQQPFSALSQPLEILRVTTPGPVNRLIKRTLIDKYDLSFASLLRSEDIAFTIPLLALAERIVTTASLKPKYHYRIAQAHNLESSKKIDDFPFWKGYRIARDRLIQYGRFDIVKISFLNAALSSCLYELDSQKNKRNYIETWDMLRTDIFPDLEINTLEEKDAAVKRNYQKMVEIMMSCPGAENGIKSDQAVPLNNVEGKSKSAIRMEKPCVSVIMPIYNSSGFLEQSLDGLLKQSLKNIEIICVNDGSTDNSLEIVKEYAKIDKRIKIIDQKNGGYGSAWNSGIKAATGEYVGNLDPDDFMDPEMYENLYKIAIENDADVVKSNFFMYYGKSGKNIFREVLKGFPYGTVMSTSENPKIICITTCIWSAIYRRQFLLDNNLWFHITPGVCYQDTAWAFKMWVCARRVVFTKKAYVHYRMDNENSSSNSKGKVFSVCDEFHSIESFLNYDKERRDKFSKVLQVLKYDIYTWNLKRIADTYKRTFQDQIALEFIKADYDGFLDQTYFTKSQWAGVQKYISDYKKDHLSSYNGRSLLKIAMGKLKKKIARKLNMD